MTPANTSLRVPQRRKRAGITAPQPPRRITVAYVPLTDCSPLIVAHEMGFFVRRGLDVRLSREAGWTTVREKMLHGEVDAAHAPASMVFQISHGLGVTPVPCLTGLILAYHGNATVVSNELYDIGVTDAASLGQLVARLKGRRRLTFACVLKYSSQHYLLRRWLRSGGIDPDKDVDIAIVPPPLMAECMEQGHLDGYCVAEPWASVGILRGSCRCITLSADFDPMHPEKVIMVRSEFEHDRHDEHVLMISALIEAARWCDKPANRPALATLLASRPYLGVPVEATRNALVGPFRMGGKSTTDASRAIVFSRDEASRPSDAKARWVIQEIRAHGLGNDLPQMSQERVSALFREDLYEEALALTPAAARSPAHSPA
ncbi:CmpA/NrtA family ABC transporter substrate-binding protein [Brevifollis gellanilyticus]|nr:CmpA/NrtA family ABC transporter substrate-binding protein [Brevifollis gellanilyticus]